MAICALKEMSSAMLDCWGRKTMMLVAIKTVNSEKIRGQFAGNKIKQTGIV